MRPQDFDDWLDELQTVVLPDFGFEEGEFTVYPDLWRGLYDQKLTPREAFQRALDAHGEARREDDAARKANWERIQREDREAIERERAQQSN
jgi:hypothetical protein